MGKTPSRSFNTVKNSNRESRLKRQQLERKVFLAIVSIAVLILLTLAVFLVSSLVEIIGNNVGGGGHGKVPQVTLSFEQKTQESTAFHKGDLIVVSKKDNLKYTFPTQSNLVLIDDIRQAQNGTNPYQTKHYRTDEKLQYPAAYAANRMLTDFYLKYEDSSLIFMDAYRSSEDQEKINSSTPVGFSEHHTGLVFTLRTYDANGKLDQLRNNAYKDWIYENAHKYGIICRYPSEKETYTGVSDYDYCFRYVGVAHATYMYENDLCLEEYVELLEEHTADNPLKITATMADGTTEAYAVYYTAASTSDQLTTLKVPKDFTDKTGYVPANKKESATFLPGVGEYTVSGDNIGGFIVTVNLTAED